MRDSGPIKSRRATGGFEFQFNGWAKYKTSNWTNIHCDDGKIFLIFHLLKWCTRKAVIVEGGAIDSNGRGTLLTSEECLNPDIQVRNQILPKQITKLFWISRNH
jgi:agmatine deiminase